MRRVSIEVKTAAILWIVTLLWLGFERAMGWHGERIEDYAMFSNLYYLLFIGMLAWAMQLKKRRMPGPGMSWKQGVQSGLIITAITVLLCPATQYFLHSWISPDLMTNLIESAYVHGTMNKFEAYYSHNLKTAIMQNALKTSVLGIVSTAMLALLFKTPKP